MRFFLLTLCFFLTTPSWAKSLPAQAEAVLGHWQKATQDEVSFRTIYIDQYKNLRMVDCEKAVNENYEETNVVVCNVEISHGAHLSYNEHKNTFRVVNQGINSLEVQSDKIVETRLFGLDIQTWQRADQKIQFLFLK